MEISMSKLPEWSWDQYYYNSELVHLYMETFEYKALETADEMIQKLHG